MRPLVRAIAALPLLVAMPVLAQAAAGSSATAPSVGLSARGSTGTAGRLGRPPQALGTTPTLSERIDTAAGLPSPTIGARTGAYGGTSFASDGNRLKSSSIGASSALDTAGRPTGSPFSPDRAAKTPAGALDRDDDPLTPQ